MTLPKIIGQQIQDIKYVIKYKLDGDNYDLELVITELSYISTENRYAKGMTLEKLRDANVRLREFGNETYQELKEAEDTISILEDRVYLLEQEIKELKKELETT